MTLFTRTLLFTLTLSLLMLGGCQKRADQPVSTTLPKSTHLGVIGFTQPTTTSELLLGTLPRKQGIVDKEELQNLDTYLRAELNKSAIPYTFISVDSKVNQMDYHESQSAQSLKKWLEFGKLHNLDMLLVPQIVDWHNRDGSQVGVDSSAHIRMEMYLLDIRNDKIFDIAFFEEKQIGLANNLLNIGTFLKRHGTWITANEMAQEAIIITLKELNL